VSRAHTATEVDIVELALCMAAMATTGRSLVARQRLIGEKQVESAFVDFESKQRRRDVDVGRNSPSANLIPSKIDHLVRTRR
jgi:hypothetical protein